MKKKRKKPTGLPPEAQERFEKSQKLLADRIAYHEARIAAREQRERGEEPGAASA